MVVCVKIGGRVLLVYRGMGVRMCVVVMWLKIWGCWCIGGRV